MATAAATEPKRRGRPKKDDPGVEAKAQVEGALIESHEDLLAAPAHARENPDMLAGDALRTLAHRRGLSRSELNRLPDEKIREQLRYLTHAQYEMG
jgi:hypothetical protein